MPATSEGNYENPGLIRFPGQERPWEHESLDQPKEVSAYGWGRVERVVGIAGCTKQGRLTESIRKAALWNHQAKFLRAKKTIKDKENRAGGLKRGRKERTWVPPKSHAKGMSSVPNILYALGNGEKLCGRKVCDRGSDVSDAWKRVFLYEAVKEMAVRRQ